MKSLVIIGRRWFQKSYGNTYHTAEVIVDGETIGTTKEEYGYGDQYIQSARDLLVEKGIIPDNNAAVNCQPLWRYCEQNNISREFRAIDVPREKDL